MLPLRNFRYALITCSHSRSPVLTDKKVDDIIHREMVWPSRWPPRVLRILIRRYLETIKT